MKAQGTVKGILFEGSDGAEPGMGKSFFLWIAFKEALKTFPPIPTWPTWSP